MGVICSSIRSVGDKANPAMRVTNPHRRRAGLCWWLFKARGCSPARTATRAKNRARFRACLPATTACKPQHLQMSRTSLGRMKEVTLFSQVVVTAEPSWSDEEPAQLGSGAGFLALWLAAVWLCHQPPCCSPCRPGRFPAVGYGMWRFGWRPK